MTRPKAVFEGLSERTTSSLLATSNAGADITLGNVALSGVKADTKNAVWSDETTPDAPVTVKGGTAVA